MGLLTPQNKTKKSTDQFINLPMVTQLANDRARVCMQALDSRTYQTE